MFIRFVNRYFWRTDNGVTRAMLGNRRLVKVLIVDICNIVQKIADKCFNLLHVNIDREVKRPLTEETFRLPDRPLYLDKSSPTSQAITIEDEKPIIFASACVDETTPGGWKYNGGIKELNLLVKLLRKHSYEAYMVTYDGRYESWLIEHQPHISINDFRRKAAESSNIRCVTSWADAHTFIRNCKDLYFWDMELAYSDDLYFSTLARLYKTKIKMTAAISRTIQAWHMCYFDRSCSLIPNICDEGVWFPIESERHFNRIGYMNEGEHTKAYIAYLKKTVDMNNMNLEFQLIKGSEADVLSLMRTCNFFLAMNLGKHPLWGEGCPRTSIEAQSAGCIPIAFDVIGNRETILSEFNGIIVARYRLDLMVLALMNMYRDIGRIEEMRKNAVTLLKASHTMESRWPAVKDFLRL